MRLRCRQGYENCQHKPIILLPIKYTESKGGIVNYQANPTKQAWRSILDIIRKSKLLQILGQLFVIYGVTALFSNTSIKFSYWLEEKGVLSVFYFAITLLLILLITTLYIAYYIQSEKQKIEIGKRKSKLRITVDKFSEYKKELRKQEDVIMKTGNKYRKELRKPQDYVNKFTEFSKKVKEILKPDFYICEEYNLQLEKITRWITCLTDLIYRPRDFENIRKHSLEITKSLKEITEIFINNVKQKIKADNNLRTDFLDLQKEFKIEAKLNDLENTYTNINYIEFSHIRNSEMSLNNMLAEFESLIKRNISDNQRYNGIVY